MRSDSSRLSFGPRSSNPWGMRAVANSTESTKHGAPLTTIISQPQAVDHFSSANQSIRASASRVISPSGAPPGTWAVLK